MTYDASLVIVDPGAVFTVLLGVTERGFTIGINYL